MSISTRWKLYSYRLPLAKKLLVLGENSAYREGLILEKITQEGSIFSEVSPLPSFHRISLMECYHELLNYIENGVIPSHPINQFGLYCLEHREYSAHEITCNGLGTLKDTELEKTKHFQIVKFKIARNDISEDVRLLKNWSANNPEKIIRLDGNRSWTKNQLFRFFEQISQLPVQYIEDPLKDPMQYSSIKGIPIALDESLVDYPEQKDAPCVTHLIIKPTLHSIEQIKNFAKTTLPLIFTSTFETSLGLWHIAQLSQNYSPENTHGFATLDWFSQDLSPKSAKMHMNQLSITQAPPIPHPIYLKLQFST